MSDLISRQAAIDAIQGRKEQLMTRQEAIGILKYSAIGGSSKVPEAIKVAVEELSRPRCGECKWRHNDDRSFWTPCDTLKVRDDWFCADGERKEAEHEQG